MAEQLKAFLTMVLPNVISPTRATRRYSRTGEYDKEIPLRSAQGMEEYFSKHVGLAERIGDLPGVLKSVDSFKEDIIKIINRNENAQNGVFFMVKDEVAKLHKQHQQIINMLNHGDLKNALPKEVHDHIITMVEQLWREISTEVSKDMMWMADLELDIARHANRMRDYSLQIDFKMKSDLGHFPTRVADTMKEEKIEYAHLVKEIMNHKDIKSMEANVKKDLKIILDAVVKEMLLIRQELKNLVMIIRDMEEAITQVFNNHVQGKLVGQMHLPQSAAQEIKNDFAKILSIIRQKSQVYFQEAKYDAQLARAA